MSTSVEKLVKEATSLREVACKQGELQREYVSALVKNHGAQAAVAGSEGCARLGSACLVASSILMGIAALIEHLEGEAIKDPGAKARAQTGPRG